MQGPLKVNPSLQNASEQRACWRRRKIGELKQTAIMQVTCRLRRSFPLHLSQMTVSGTLSRHWATCSLQTRPGIGVLASSLLVSFRYASGTMSSHGRSTQAPVWARNGSRLALTYHERPPAPENLSQRCLPTVWIAVPYVRLRAV